MSDGVGIDEGRRDGLGRALAWLAHPVSVGGLVLLLLNDHLLKAWYPGQVTGKLSDLAGMLMFPPLLACLAALAPRLPERVAGPLALALTAAGFTAVKAVEPGARLASQAWSVLHGPSVVRADATDLLVLPALALSWWAWRRAGHARRPAGRTLRTVRALVLVPAALLATVATSAPMWPETNWVGTDEAGAILVETVNGYHDSPFGYVRSTDGGATFTPVPLQEQPDERPQDGRREDCLGQVCYRAVEGELHVQSSQDGGRTWTTAWQVRGRQLAALVDWYEPKGFFSDSGETDHLSSQSLRVFPSGSGHVVIVANGPDGILRRDVDGTWTRLGIWTFDRWDPVPPLADVWEPTIGARVTAALFTAGAIGLLVLLVAAAAARTYGPGGGDRRFVLLGAPILGGTVFLVDTLYASTPGPEGAGVVAGLLLAVLNLAALALAGWALARALRRGLLPPGRLVPVLLAAVAAIGLTAWWHDGAVVTELDSRAPSVALHVLAGLAATGVALAAVRLRRPVPPVPPEPPEPREEEG
ncbi:hypothetical protein [Catellatospora sp. TT07R-123]|uniref:hypothetical protein n=1 Tax=Catellatospora sp. TT07R-123 TaxID=2733863 RepID=UPI001BB3D383|nr:hypothetical protein [Catellatospora sp. TT07R-123]